MTGRIRKIALALGTALAVVALLIAFHPRILPFFLTWLDVGEKPRKADVIFALLGGNDVRPFAAAALYRAGFAQDVVLSVVRHRSPLKYSRPSHVIFGNVLRKRGVPDSAIHFIGADVDNTMNESDALRDYLQAHPQATVLVVTTHFHTRRTRWSLSRRLGPLANQLHFVSCPHDDFDETNWWLFPGGFELIVMEYVKLVGYWVFYGNAVWYATISGVLIIAWCGWRRKNKRTKTATISADTQ